MSTQYPSQYPSKQITRIGNYLLLVFLAFGNLSIDAQTVQATLDFTTTHPVSPLIFGYNQDHEAPTGTENWGSRRLGGNRMTTFNWENGASTGESPSFANSNRIPGLLGVLWNDRNKQGEAFRKFHQDNLNANVVSIVTLPIQGHVAADKDGANVTTPPSARWKELVYVKGAPFSLLPDTSDGFVYLDESMNFLVQTFGNATTNNGVKYIALDNEPAYWENTHSHLQPNSETAADYVQKVIAAAKAVKAVDPNVKIIAGEFGGTNIFDFGSATDWGTVGAGYDWFISYFLDELKQASDLEGYNLIDVLSTHFYPQHKIDAAGNFSSSGVVVRESNLTTDYIRSSRMQFARSLWDETYIEPSWLTNGKLGGEPHKVLQRIKSSIENFFPGTEMMIGEFDFGFDTDISHGISMADALGVFVQYDMKIVNRWDLNPYNANTYTSSAYRLYRNYDGVNGTIGNMAVPSTFDNPDIASVWATLDTDNEDIHLILLNKDQASAHDFQVDLGDTQWTYTLVDIWGFDDTSMNLAQPTHNASIATNTLNLTLPQLSAYHLIVHRDIVLPIDLLSFTAEADQADFSVHLSWETSPSTNSNHFIPQSSKDSRNWKDLDHIESQNSPILPVLYTFLDHHPNAGRSYYRLKLIDTDGEVTFSEIRTVYLVDNEAILIYPNPAQDFLYFEFEQSKPLHLSLYDTNGKLLLTKKNFTGDRLEIQFLPKGSYILTFNDGQREVVKRYLKL